MQLHMLVPGNHFSGHEPHNAKLHHRSLLEILWPVSAVAVFMFVMVSQINRVRTLTDEGERLQRAAEALSGEELGSHLPLAAALRKAGDLVSDEARLYDRLHDQLRATYYGAATLRRSRKKK